MSRLFNGSSDYLQAASALVTAYPFTISAWLKPAALAGSTAFSISDPTDVPGDYCTLSINSSGQLFSETVNGTTTSDAFGSPSDELTTGAWQHVAAVHASATSHIGYSLGVGGTPDTTAVVLLGDISTVTVGCLAADGSLVVFFNGQIAQVSIWNTALSSGQIASLAGGAVPTTIASANLLGYWPIAGVASPEPSYTGAYGPSLTVNGTTAEPSDNPPVGGGGAVAEVFSVSDPYTTRIPGIH